ncbi:MAG: response regulator transcription factor [Blastocatellia bacterium]
MFNQSAKRSVRVLLADDSPCFLRALSRMLSSEGGFEIVGQASSGNEAVESTLILRPDLVLMDVSMPGLSGLEATSIIKEQAAAPRVIIVTLNDDGLLASQSRQVKADGFISKASVALELIPLIRQLFAEPVTTLSAGTGIVSSG